MKKRLLLIPLIIFLIVPMVGSKDTKALSGPRSSVWWKSDWHYRIKVKIYSGSFERDNEPVELKVDFESLLSQSGISGTLDINSLRIIDQDETPREVVSQFEPTSGEIIWLTGRLDADTSKTYYVYFDILENGPKSPPRYYDTMENGGILVLPLGGYVSVLCKIGGKEYETARIDEATGEISYLKPPFGSSLIDGQGTFLGFKKQEGMFEKGVVSITGGPLRYNIEFHYEPRAPKSAVVFSDYCYTFYYVSNGQEVRAKFDNKWAASQSFIPQHNAAEWPEAFGIQGENPGRLETAFLATASDTVTLYDIFTTWGPLDGDTTRSLNLGDNFWGMYGEDGGIGIIPVSPDYSSLSVDGYRSNNGWDWSAIYKSQVGFIERGTYCRDFWIYGYIQKGWDLAKDFGNRAEEPITVAADLNLSSAAYADSNDKAKVKVSVERDVPAFPGFADNTSRRDPGIQKFRVAWLGSDWTYRKRLTFNNSSQSENLINFPVLVILTPGNFDYSHCQSDGRDIRFVDADDTTELKYQIEDWNYNGDSYIWVKVPQIDGSSSTDYIWMYYGNSGAADGQDAENVWDSNYVAVWHLSEGGIGTRSDSTLNNNDGTPQNYDGDEAVTGQINGADNLDGVNDYVGIPGSNIGTTSVTVEAWVRFNDLNSTTFSPTSGSNPGATLFSTRELDGNQSPTLCVSPVSGGAGSHKGAIFTFDSAGDARGAKGQTTIQLGQWYYLVGAFAYTGSGAYYGNWNVYVNGNRDNVSANNFNYAGSISMPFNGTPWRIGDQNQWTNGETNATIDEVRLSRIARSPDWIAAQFRSMSNNFITFGSEASATKIRIEDSADGSGAEIDTRTIASGASFTGYAISRDASDNFVANVAVTWSLIDKTGGVVDGDLVVSGDAKSAIFTGLAVGTGRIRAQHTTLGEDTTGVITVTAGAATRIRIEDRADGTGAEIDTRTIASGASFTGYAISRDGSNNFVANVAVTWSLIDKTGGVVDSDLVASGDAKSAIFTGLAVGTGRIRAQHTTLGEDTTGVITVTAGAAATIRIEDTADGSGAEIDTRTLASGASFTGYAISRDASNNFVDNVAVTWSLIDKTGGVVDGDLVVSGDAKSAIFTGHAVGTGRIRTQHTTLGEDTTGVITVTAGTAARIRIEDTADGSGAEIDTRTIASGASFTGYAISRDASNNFVDNVAVTWSLIDKTGGVVDGDLVASGDAKSAIFTGHLVGTARIRAQHASLGEDTTGVITVTAGAATRIRIEDRADGTGAEIDTRTIASGASFTGYAISRDGSNNFVANVAVTWSLIDKTGGVVDSDLVASGDNRSATFGGHATGTARISAQHATLGSDATGVITVAAGTASRIVIEDAADGTGTEVNTRTIASGASFTGYAISRDGSNNFVANVAVTWSLIDRTGGVADGDLVASGDARSATFTGYAAGTGRIRAQHAALGEDTTGVITVTAGAAATMRIEDRADGTGTEIGTRTVASGASFAGYAISRDGSNNFVANVAVTWSLIDKTGGVVDSDLVASGDNRSATFGGHATGTARISAQHATLGSDATGVIMVAAGTASRIVIEDAADGTGTEVNTRTIASGASFTGYAISRDGSNNFVANVAVTWSLIDKTGGVADSDLVVSGDAKSVVFTGHLVGTARIRAQHAALGEDTTGVITVTAGAAATMRIEDRADGTGTEIGTRTVASGASFAGYAISRDGSNNFVANEAVTWSLIDKTGGVVDSDLVVSGDARSATFTGHAAGTGRMRAQHATLGRDSTGMITVTAVSQPPVALFKFAPITGSVPCEICFDASSSYDPDGYIVSYAWDFGDGSGGQGVSACHTYTFGAEFLVTLRVTDNSGLSDAATAQINLQAAVYPPVSVSLKREINRSLFRKEAFHTISWSLNPANNGLTITSYRIYRKEASKVSESYQLIGVVLGDTFAYVDGYLDVNIKYTYAVTSVDSSGHESTFSSPVGN